MASARLSDKKCVVLIVLKSMRRLPEQEIRDLFNLEALAERGLALEKITILEV